MTLSLPIPGKKDKIAFFYIPYHVGNNYYNNKGEVHLRESDSIKEFREQVRLSFGLDEGSYIITSVQENLMKKMID